MPGLRQPANPSARPPGSPPSVIRETELPTPVANFGCCCCGCCFRDTCGPVLNNVGRSQSIEGSARNAQAAEAVPRTARMASSYTCMHARGTAERTIICGCCQSRVSTVGMAATGGGQGQGTRQQQPNAWRPPCTCPSLPLSHPLSLCGACTLRVEKRPAVLFRTCLRPSRVRAEHSR
jgi:hypothetical protein